MGSLPLFLPSSAVTLFDIERKAESREQASGYASGVMTCLIWV